MTEHDQPHLPPPSLWPIGFAVGVACALAGLLLSWAVAAVGALIAIVFGFLWVRDLTKPVRGPAPEVEPESRHALTTAEPDEDDADSTHTRSTFLSGATLGLGAVIGGLITIPVLGFAVLPSFTTSDTEEIDLGPIENFPESEFVITTFLEDATVGEVTRRTMFIRNNGQLDGQQSFTMLYSRCVHLGCPVQPNGPIEEDQKKTYDNTVDLIPVLAVGFGCPCHGGQYDTEGNRVAGPPVRALDRAQFSIRDGNLFMGAFFSVSEVDGTGATARIHTYGRAVPGVHVDGPSAWLYPIEVPQ